MIFYKLISDSRLIGGYNVFLTLDKALSVLTKRTSSSFFELKRFHECIEDLGNPQHQLKCIHVAGTNGKGSTSNFLTYSLIEEGYKVGCFTSPHLISHNDRFTVNHLPISDEQLLQYINQSYPLWDEYYLSMFEIDTLIAIWYFLDQGVDWAVFEVGLGGRLDATNIVYGQACVITSIGFDHMDLLGDTLGKIAYEKAGIIKSGSIVLTAETNQEPKEVIESVAKSFQNPLYIVEAPSLYQVNKQGLMFHYHNHSIQLSTHAHYQISNASLAFETLIQLKEHGKLNISVDSILKGLKKAHWAGRFEKMSEHPRMYIDGAHNEHGVRALVSSLKGLPKPWIIVFAALKDKETDKMVTMLYDVADQMIVTEFPFYRAQKAEQLAIYDSIIVIEDMVEAINVAKSQVNEGTIIITGSLYFISDVRRVIMNT